MILATYWTVIYVLDREMFEEDSLLAKEAP
jgi:hypothetical protein